METFTICSSFLLNNIIWGIIFVKMIEPNTRIFPMLRKKEEEKIPIIKEVSMSQLDEKELKEILKGSV